MILPLSSLVVAVQLFSPADSLRPHGLQASLSITNSQSLLKPMSVESMMLSNHLILHRPLLLPQSLPASVFSNESLLRLR